MPTPEQQARSRIDALLEAAGWSVQDADAANIHAARGVAIREFPLSSPSPRTRGEGGGEGLSTDGGYADYLLYVDGKAAGVIEAKKEGATLAGVEIQSARYAHGLPAGLPAWRRPLPFLYESTGVETRFTNGLDPQPRARPVFAFHKADALAQLLHEMFGRSGAPAANSLGIGDAHPRYEGGTFLSRLRAMPPLVEHGLWPAQVKAIQNLEQSLKENRPRALIQMATGSGKTFTAISFIYRLIKFAGARRVLFLVDRGNLADQTLKEFQQYASPYNNFKFSEEYIVQRLTSNTLDTTARVCICTIQRLYAMLKGKELPEDLDEVSVGAALAAIPQVEPIEYNPAIPIETFDIIVTDEAHRSIYKLWAQVLEYFDAYLIGLTATPSKQTFGFFNQNLVMEYSHEMAVADGVNVNYDVYRIRTQVTEQGGKVEAGYFVQMQDRETRARRWERLDEDLGYEARQIDRDVVVPDQIRTVVRTFRDKLKTDIFPGREWVPKTLIFAKDDAHAENIVEIVRQEFGDKGSNEFCKKITYRTTGAKPKDLINEFRTSPMPRIAVTVDMIATGTDIKPVEIVMFMRQVQSRTFFEQMKGRGVRVIKSDDLRAVTPDAVAKDHFVIVDCVGVCEQEKTDAHPMEQAPSVPFEDLLKLVSFGATSPDILSSLAGRLARMEHRLSAEDDLKIRQVSGGLGLKDIARQIVRSLDPDRHLEQARTDLGIPADSDQPVPTLAIRTAAEALARQALGPLHDPGLRELLVEVKRKELIIDIVSPDTLVFAGFSEDKAKGVITSFQQFIVDHKDEITALQILYSRPYRARLNLSEVRELADRLVAELPPLRVYATHPNNWEQRVPEELWQAYRKLDTRVSRHAGVQYLLTDLVALVRYAIHQDNELIPFPERVNANFKAWLASVGAASGREQPFTDEQLRWLEMIRDHIAANLGIEPDDFEYAPFSQHGGLGKVHQLFGDKLNAIIEELNETLAA